MSKVKDKRSLHLHQLIHALTPSEKGYFKKQVAHDTTGKPSKALRLFDLVNKQSEYDEAALLAADFISNKKTFSELKRYLYQLILQSLRQYHEKNYVKARLHAMLDEIELLYERMLDDQCLKITARAKKLAQRFEAHPILVKVLEWELMLIQPSTKAYDSTQKLLSELHKSIQNLSTLKMLITDINNLYMITGGLQVPEKRAEFNRIFEHPFVTDTPPLRSKKERLLFAHLSAYINYTKKDWRTCYSYSRQAIEIIDEHPEIFKEDIDFIRFCTGILKRHFVVTSFLDRLDEAEEATKKFGQLISESRKPRLQLWLLSHKYPNLLHLYIAKGEFEEGLQIVEEIAGELEQFEHRTSPTIRSILYYNFAYILFGNGKYKRSLYWLNKLLNDIPPNTRGDVQQFALLFQLILYYELGERDILPYIIRSTVRYMKRSKELFKIEAVVLEFMREKLLKISPFQRSELKQAFRGLKEEIEKLCEEDKDERQALEYFDYISWIESKLESRSFQEIFRDKSVGYSTESSKNSS